MAVNTSIGTFCVVLSSRIAVSNCPLPQGACVWKHRVTGQCKYTPANLSVNELADLIGVPQISNDEFDVMKERLREAIKTSLSNK